MSEALYIRFAGYEPLDVDALASAAMQIESGPHKPQSEDDAREMRIRRQMLVLTMKVDRARRRYEKAQARLDEAVASLNRLVKTDPLLSPVYQPHYRRDRHGDLPTSSENKTT